MTRGMQHAGPRRAPRRGRPRRRARPRPPRGDERRLHGHGRGPRRGHEPARRRPDRPRGGRLEQHPERAFCVGADLKERNAFTDERPARPAPAGAGGIPAGSSTCRCRRRGGRRLRPRRRLRDRAVLRPHRRGRGRRRRAARGHRRRDPRRRRHPAADAPGRLVAGGQHDLHRPPPDRGRGARARGRRRGRRRRARPATGPSSSPRRSPGNSPVGVRNAKRAMRQGFDTDLAAGLDIEDECWAATAFSGDRAEGVAAFDEKRRPGGPVAEIGHLSLRSPHDPSAAGRGRPCHLRAARPGAAP